MAITNATKQRVRAGKSYERQRITFGPQSQEMATHICTLHHEQKRVFSLVGTLTLEIVMKKLLTLKKGVSSVDIQDVEMLTLLLYEILDFFDQSHDEILIGEIDVLVRHLGYRGSMHIVRNTLLHNNFLTEIERGNRYILSNSNRSAIEYFFLKHKIEFEGNRLTNIEYAHILGSSGIQGSRVEALLAQVMGSLAFLMDALLQIPSIESSIRAEIAEHATKSLILMERAKWKTERLYQLEPIN